MSVLRRFPLPLATLLLTTAALLLATAAAHAGHHEEGEKAMKAAAGAAAQKAAPATKVPPRPPEALLSPNKARKKAPATFKVKFETTKGDFVLAVTRKWSPNGADRFYNLVKIGYFNDIAWFRVLKQPRMFMCQTGLHGDPAVNRAWMTA